MERSAEIGFKKGLRLKLAKAISTIPLEPLDAASPALSHEQPKRAENEEGLPTSGFVESDEPLPSPAEAAPVTGVCDPARKRWTSGRNIFIVQYSEFQSWFAQGAQP